MVNQTGAVHSCICTIPPAFKGLSCCSPNIHLTSSVNSLGLNVNVMWYSPRAHFACAYHIAIYFEVLIHYMLVNFCTYNTWHFLVLFSLTQFSYVHT